MKEEDLREHGCDLNFGSSWDVIVCEDCEVFGYVHSNLGKDMEFICSYRVLSFIHKHRTHRVSVFDGNRDPGKACFFSDDGSMDVGCEVCGSTDDNPMLCYHGEKGKYYHYKLEKIDMGIVSTNIADKLSYAVDEAKEHIESLSEALSGIEGIEEEIANEWDFS